MKNDLDHSTLLRLFNYDPDTGVFTRRVNAPPRGFAGNVVGMPDSNGYLRASVHGKFYFLHRLALFYVTGTMPTLSVDHINGVKYDNRLCNLREVNHAANMQNVHRVNPRNKTGVTGVYLRKDTQRYSAEITANGKGYSLGCFDDLKSAEAAYLAAKRKHHKGVAV